MTSTRTARYVDVLALPRVPRTFGAALVGRAAYALVFLPLLYAVSEATGSIALAGGAVAAYGAAASFLAPARAWFIDRFGARRVLSALVVLFASALVATAVASLLSGSAGLLIASATVAGAVAPPLGPTMRVAWGSLAPDDDHLRTGLSLDAVVEELLYLAGPALAGLALVFLAPGLALLVPAVLVLVGGLLFAATPVIAEMPAHGRAAPNAERGRTLLADRRFVGLLLPVLVAGSIAGSLGVAVPSALADHGGSSAAGLALGVFAGGSAVGGLLYGALKVSGSPTRQILVLSTLLLASSSAVAVATGAVAVSLVLALAGLFFSPVMIVAYVAAHTAGGENRQNAATTWVNTSHNLGSAAGSAAAGVLVQAGGVTMAVGIGAVVWAALLAASALLAGAGTAAQSGRVDAAVHRDDRLDGR